MTREFVILIHCSISLKNILRILINNFFREIKFHERIKNFKKKVLMRMKWTRTRDIWKMKPNKTNERVITDLDKQTGK